MLLLGHNGLRNLVAYNKSVANMNLLHWDMDLQHMAEGWIKQCQITTDSCNFIRFGDRVKSVGQNIRFESAEKLTPYWIVLLVKHWFFEGRTEKYAQHHHVNPYHI